MAKKTESTKSTLKSKISKPQSLRVLIVEDSEDDTLLEIRELKKGGYNPVQERVETAAAMKKALQEKQWDIILCDYKLPKFNAPSAIALLNESNTDIPLIVVSGAIGEETAVECMRLGAHDYIMKNNLSRLCPAIARELEEAESRRKRKQAEEALRSEQIMLTRTEGITHVGSWEWNIATDTVTWSDELFRIFQRDPREGAPSFAEHPAFYHPDDMAHLRQAVEAAITDGTPYVLELRAIRKDGETRVCIARGVAEMAPGGRPSRLFGSLQDITERKQAEELLRESEARYRLLADNITDTVWLMDMNLNITYNSPSVAKKRGYTDEEIKQIPLEKHLTPESLNKAITAFSEEMAKVKADPSYIFDRSLELEIFRKDGTTFWSEITSSLIRDENGISISILSEGRDITERKQIEETLRQSEEKYRNIIENMQDGYYENDLGGNFTFVNDALCRIIGYPREELIGKNNRQYTDEETAKKIYQVYNKIYKTGEPSKGIEEEYIRKDGIKVFAELSVSLIHDAEGKPIGFRGISRDITERMQAEVTLRESEKKYRELYDFLPISIFEIDTTGTIISFNPTSLETFGYKQEDYKNDMTALQFFAPEDLNRFAENIQMVIDGTSTPGQEYIFLRKDGSTFPGLIYASSIIQANKTVGIRGAITNITERKQAEESLRESEERYKALFDRSLDLVYVIDFEGRFIDANDAALNQLGYTREEIHTLNFTSLLSEDQLPLAIKIIQEIQETGIQRDLAELRLRHKNGREVYVETKGSIIISNGTPVAIQAIARDITERKRAEEIMRVSEEKYRLVVENAKEAIIITQDVKLVFVNRAAVDMTGYSAEILTSKSFTDFIHPDDRNMVVAHHIGRVKGEEVPPVYSFRIISQDGTVKWAELNATLIQWKERPATLNFLNDITERKRAEEELRKSEENFRCSLDDSSLGVRIVTVEGETLYANQATLEIFGNDNIEELKRTPIKAHYTPESYADFQIRNEKRRQGEFGPSEYEISIVRKNGEIRHVQVFRKEVIWDGARQFQIIYQDITKNKEAEKALRESEYQYKSLIDNIPDIIFTIDLEGKITFVSKRTKEILGYENAETINRNIFNFIPEEDHERALENLQKGMKGEKIKHFQIPMITKPGEKLFFECYFSRVYKDGAVVGAQGTAVDITERKRAEEERKQSFERMRKALGATVQAISLTVEMRDPYTSGHQRRVSDLARSMATEMGLSADRQDFIRTAASIHDIGKISIPSEILSKPTKLTDLEFNLIKTHSQSGYDILKDIEFPWPVADVVLQHHERMDGSGYPQGIKGADILLEARILAIADVVEAIASHRPYRPALGIDIALKEISDNKGILYDADAVDVCLKLFREKGYTLVIKKS